MTDPTLCQALVPVVTPRASSPRVVRKRTARPLGTRLVLVSRAVRDHLVRHCNFRLTPAQARYFKGAYDLERGLFIYVLYVELGEPLEQVANVTGLSRTTIKEIAPSVEDLRAVCGRTERLIAGCVKQVRGGGYGTLL
jgi:hypothetical protein